MFLPLPPLLALVQTGNGLSEAYGLVALNLLLPLAVPMLEEEGEEEKNRKKINERVRVRRSKEDQEE